MKPIVHRICLIFLTIVGVGVGGWAYFAPLNWYNTFPGLGMTWLPVLGPYNEHFVKDVGSMYLGLAALSALALYYVGNRAVVVVTAICVSVFNMLHLIYHLGMLHMYGPRDAVLNVVALSLVLVASLLLLVPARSRDGG
ncbi:hypothetical protein MTER_32360 [Mycolicibacter terrae]|uniref:DUF4345 domain-containing protein n=1 Tax=Mycolicibacter terrae TaxID=1788 RepID=A0AAD1I116_9MYCO|nr:hypothetical protein [Mycolicibacter terrae]ORW92274.1 hypothetical protein AWC28_17665 [Mycolicibacter terrae]BBX23825.1 hypothetical protein MTER_32360 [Mycolicibacter terrae]SNV59512.1 Uncharacterised protein [Mycolicibacter terrae]